MNNSPFKDSVYKYIENKTASIIWGNGINNYINVTYKNIIPEESRIPSWKNLIVEVAKRFNKNVDKNVEKESLSYPEWFSMISEHGDNDIHNAVAEILIEKSKKNNDYIQKVADQMKEWGCPVITTNYDISLENSLGLRYFRKGNHESDKYPINLYAASQETKDSKKDFAIWHCNGIVTKPISMKLDLGDYCLYAARLRNIIPLSSEKYNPKPLFLDSWLSAFYQNTLVIIGLGLPTSEFYLRWLLLERAMNNIGGGFYIYAEDKTIDNNFKAFLNYVGITPISYPTWKDMYMDIFGI